MTISIKYHVLSFKKIYIYIYSIFLGHFWTLEEVYVCFDFQFG